MKKTVLVVDDHAAIRYGIRVVLKPERRFRIVAEARNGLEALQEAKRHTPDIIILDASMPVMNGFDAARELRAIVPDSWIIGLSLYSRASVVQEMLAAGVTSFVFKSGDLDEHLVAAMNAAAEGQRYIAPDVRAVLEEARAERAPRKRFDLSVLSQREKEVLCMLDRGLPHKEIAARMCVSTNTIKTHIQNLRQKTGRHKTAELIMFAQHVGLARP